MMDSLYHAGKYWASLASIVADGNHHIEGLTRELVDMLRAMPRDIDPYLSHHGDSFRTHPAGFYPGAFRLEALAEIVAQ